MAELKDDSIIEEQYKQRLNHKKQIKQLDECAQNEKFKGDDHWPKETEKTKSLPRPSFPLVKFIIQHKIASVLNENVKMIFSPQEVPEKDEQGNDISNDENLQRAIDGADKFTRFSENTWEENDEEELLEEQLDDAATTGTTIAHFYWDSSAEGGISTKYVGAMKEETIDVVNYFPANPQQKDPQKQPDIIISSREGVVEVREYAKENGVPKEKIALIQADKETENEAYESAKVEVTGSEMTTVLTKYWKDRKTKTWWFAKRCSGITIKEPTDTGKKLCPIAVMHWDLRKKSAYGGSEAKGLISINKLINFVIAMWALSVQETGWPKILAKYGALKQQITNTPGEIIIDYSQTPGVDGIKFMQPGTVSTQALQLADKVIDYARTFTGANEAATGDPFTRDLNASAIIAMQNAAKIPLDKIRKRFYRFLKDKAKIWEEFYKVNYNLDRKVAVKDDNGQETSMTFNGSQYADIPMRLKIDISSSASVSDALTQATLDRLLDKGLIPLNIYVELSSKEAMPFKEKLLKMLKAQEEAAQQQMIQQQQDIDSIIAGLPPELQQEFAMASPEEQQTMMQQVMGGMA